jgi:hypothetical protein
METRQPTTDEQMQEYLLREQEERMSRNKKNEQMDKVVEELTSVNLKEYDQKLKDHKNEVKEKLKPKVKSIDGKPLLLKQVIDDITSIKSNFGYSWRLKCGNANYYYNSSIETGIDKMFKKGKMAVFTVKESPNKKEPNNPYLVVEHVFFNFF